MLLLQPQVWYYMVRNIFDYYEWWFVDFPITDWQTPADASRCKKVLLNVEENLRLGAAGDLCLASVVADAGPDIGMAEDPR